MGYGDGGYDDGSGIIDPNTGMPMQGAGGSDGNKGFGDGDFDRLIRSKMVKSEGMWQCTECQYSTKKSSNLFEHIESRHCPSQGYTCAICNKFCPTRNAMR